MPRFFVDAQHISGDRCAIRGADARHIAGSLRGAAGDVISVADDAGMEYTVTLDVVGRALVEGRVVLARRETAEPHLRVHVVQSLPRQGMDEAVEAMSQVGAATIRPVVSDRSVARPDAARAANRVERWRAIARENAGLAYRGRAPAVEELADLADAMQRLPAGTRVLACSIGGEAVPLGGIAPDPDRPVALCIGPEGGWSGNDMATLLGVGAEQVHLGPRVLRTRLAGAIGCAMLLTSAGDCARAATPIGDPFA